MADQYDLSLRLLLHQAEVNLSQIIDPGPLRNTCQMLVDGLRALSLDIRRRYPVISSESTTDSLSGQERFKVRCRLSVDQIAIIFKAADEMQLLISRSFSLVLRSIVPFLSTDRFENFSWKSARSSVYKIEGSDREIAIKTLEALIAKIRTY
jgi:hypothetical protein